MEARADQANAAGAAASEEVFLGACLIEPGSFHNSRPLAKSCVYVTCMRRSPHGEEAVITDQAALRGASARVEFPSEVACDGGGEKEEARGDPGVR